MKSRSERSGTSTKVDIVPCQVTINCYSHIGLTEFNFFYEI